MKRVDGELPVTCSELTWNTLTYFWGKYLYFAAWNAIRKYANSFWAYTDVLQPWAELMSTCFTYKSPCLVVMEVDLRLDVSCPFSWVEKWFGEVDTEIQVVGATSPLPSASTPSSLLWGHVETPGALAAQAEPLPVPSRRPITRGIAPTSDQLPHAASSSNAVRHPSRRDGVGKGGFTVPWQT